MSKLKQVFNIANVVSQSLFFYNEYCNYQITKPDTPISLHIIDFANVKNNSISIENYIHEKEIYEEKKLDLNIFYIFITNTSISPAKIPAILLTHLNVKTISVPPGREEDDAICLCLAAHYINDRKDINNLCIITNDNYNNIQHTYYYNSQVLPISFTDLYNRIMSYNNLQNLCITSANVTKISSNTIKDNSEINQSKLTARIKKIADYDEARVRAELIKKFKQQKESQSQSQYMNKYCYHNNVIIIMLS